MSDSNSPDKWPDSLNNREKEWSHRQRCVGSTRLESFAHDPRRTLEPPNTGAHQSLSRSPGAHANNSGRRSEPSGYLGISRWEIRLRSWKQYVMVAYPIIGIAQLDNTATRATI
ncbi:Hypothetical protein NTJ_02416 [Nesidiocoris tenuis]|uniref:Uncharacterized protein n=1 Tax=Nesidiocoris tenuis TaxID=355587 RepID=A0ABN7AEK3_9HEMI|nr:Hypothetical protein NTJ_02416 [Nesidiocoris tenuis]